MPKLGSQPGWVLSCLHLPPGGTFRKPVGPFCQIHVPDTQFWWQYISSFGPSVAPQYLPNECTPLALAFKARSLLSLFGPLHPLAVYILQALNQPLHWSHPAQWTVAPCGQETSIFCMIRARNKWSRIWVSEKVKLNLCKNNRNYTRRTLSGCVFLKSFHVIDRETKTQTGKLHLLAQAFRNTWRIRIKIERLHLGNCIYL